MYQSIGPPHRSPHEAAYRIGIEGGHPGQCAGIGLLEGAFDTPHEVVDGRFPPGPGGEHVLRLHLELTQAGDIVPHEPFHAVPGGIERVRVGADAAGSARHAGQLQRRS